MYLKINFILGNLDIILYLVGISPANDHGQMVDDLNIMDYLHSKAGLK